MDSIKARDLPLKAKIDFSEQILIEDYDGTKLIPLSELNIILRQGNTFDTVADMQEATLVEGDVVTTLGYRDRNDGGGATYVIVYSPTDVSDGIFIHYLHTSDTLRAHLISNGDLNLLQAGAFGNGIADDYTIIKRCIDSGYPLTIPKRTYRITGPLELPSDCIMDFNGSTIICETSACLQIGTKDVNKNIVIRNAVFQGKYGIYIDPYASNITVEDCVFRSSAKVFMSKAICITGASEITISNCDIGNDQYTTKYGIFLASGNKNGEIKGNSNIMISTCRIIVNKVGIDLTSGTRERNIILSDNIIKSTTSVSRNQIDMVGIKVACNCDALVISSCGLSRMYKGIEFTGTFDISASCTDIICDDIEIMYNVGPINAKIHLGGLQRFNGSEASEASGDVTAGKTYLFEYMNGELYLDSDFDISVLNSGISINQARVSLMGALHDGTDPRTLEPIRVTSTPTASLDNPIPAYKNVFLDYAVSGNITNLEFPSLHNQTVAIKSSSGAVLKNNNKILCGEDITLSPYIPVLLRNVNGQWLRVG